jgi:hypothetical protein
VAKHTTSGTDLDVQSVDAELLAAGGDVLGSQHGSVGGGLVTVGLDLHSTGDTGDGFTAGQIGDVDEGVVEGGEDTGNAEDELACSIAVSTWLSICCVIFILQVMASAIFKNFLIAAPHSTTTTKNCPTARRHEFFLSATN